MSDKKDGFQLDPQMRGIVGRHFSIYDTNVGYDYLSYFVTLPDNEGEAYDSLRDELKAIGYLPVLRRKGGETVIEVLPAPAPKRSKLIINFLLLAATIGTTILVGTTHWMGYKGVMPSSSPEILISQLLGNLPMGFLYFSVPLLLILGTHELGHYFMSRYHGVDASLPYFIPAPTTFGTFGAFISVKEPIPTKKALMDIGIAGPLAGLVVAIPVTLLGLYLSSIDPAVVNSNTTSGTIVLGLPILFKLLAYAVPTSSDIIHPTAFAGWVGIFVTAINLLPAGQLDGGHVARSILGNKAKILSIVGVAFLVLLGFIFGQYGWFLFAIIIVFLGMSHPPPLNDVTPLDGKRVAVGILAAMILVVCFVPNPISSVSRTVSYDLEFSDGNIIEVGWGEENGTFIFDVVNTGNQEISVFINASAINWGSSFSIREDDGNLSTLPYLVGIPAGERRTVHLVVDSTRGDPGANLISLESVCDKCAAKRMQKSLTVIRAGFEMELETSGANLSVSLAGLMPLTQNITLIASVNGTWMAYDTILANGTIKLSPNATLNITFMPDEAAQEVNICARSDLGNEHRLCRTIVF